jgi:tetratricopeptide (TPR) repeat protein
MTASLPVALALLLTAVSSRDTQEAERLAKESMADYNLGEFEAALNNVSKAYRLDPRPAFLFNLGQCYRALHQWERAEFFYRGFLREKPEASNREVVLGLISEMQRKLEVARLEAQIPPTPPAPVVLAAPPLAAHPEPTPAAVTKAEPAPPAPVSTPEKSRSHALGITLGAVAVGALVGAAIGEGLVLNFNQVNSQIQHNTYTGTYGAAVSAQNNANTGCTVALALVFVAAAAFTGAALTW